MRRNIAPILGVLLLGAVAAALYGWYFLGQRQRIAELNQRELGRAADNIQSILQNAVVNVRNLTKQPAFTCKFLARQPYLVLPTGKDCKKIVGATREEPEPTWLHIEEDTLAIRTQDTHLEFRVQLEKILDELVVGNGFEYLFVASGKGDVLFLTKRGEQKRWTDTLRWSDRHGWGERPKPASTLQLRNIADLRTDADGKAGLQNLTKTTNALRVEIAGEEYRLYLQPLGWPALMATPGSGDHAIVLGGLVDARASIAEALTVEPRLALALAALAGLGLLTWPVVKFFVLAPSERFKFVDLHLLILSTSALLGFCTVILLALDSYQWLSSSTYLENLANHVDSGLGRQLRNELSDAANQLVLYDSELARNGAMDCEPPLAEGKRVFENHNPKGLQVSPPSLYQHLTAVFWVRGVDGWQFAKLTPIDENTPRVNLTERAYFREARERHLWGFADGTEPEPGFFVQVYRSMTTGDIETGLSRPSDVACKVESKDGAPNVAVLTTTLASLSPKSLPADYGFMVIDRAGRVLYHSDPRRALREDLFDEISQPERLRALVMTGGEAHIVGSYRSVPHELYIRPLRELVLKQPKNDAAASKPKQFNGWFIVTFRDLQLCRTANSEAGVTALVWYAVYFICLQFVPALILVVRGRKHNGWIWPSPAKEPLYRSLTIGLTVLAAAAIAGMVVTRGWALFAASCLTGAGAMTLGTWEYLRWKAPQKKSGASNSSPGDTPKVRPWRLSAAALLFILVSILPAAGFFKFAWNQELGTLLAFEARHLAETAEDLKLQITDNARDRFAPVYGKDWREVVQGAIDEQENAIGAASHEEVNGPRSVDVLAGWKPVYNDATAHLRYEESRPDLMAGRNLSIKPGPFALIGGMLLIGVLLRWMRYCDRHLFLSDLEEIVADGQRSDTYYWSLWNSCDNVEKLVLVHVAEEGFANPRQTQTVKRLLRRGLLVMDPDLRVFRPEFRQYIQETYDRKAVAEWERADRGMGWTQTRWILTIILVTAAVFLIGTQRQSLTPIVGFVSTLTGAFAGILKLVSEVNAKQRPTA